MQSRRKRKAAAVSPSQLPQEACLTPFPPVPARPQPQEPDPEDLLIAQAIDQELQSAEAHQGKRVSLRKPPQHVLVRTALQVRRFAAVPRGRREI